MEAIGHWIPGDGVAPQGPLARYAEPTPRGVAEAYVRAYTSPGDVVLIPFCDSATLVHEVRATGRRVLALDFNPVGILALRMALAPPPRDALRAVLTALGDRPKAGRPLREHLGELYVTPCPHCGRTAVVEAIVWDREAGQPVERRYRCPACGHRGSGPPAEADLLALEQVEGTQLAYWYLVERVAPLADPHQSFVRHLLDLYTPRNLYALAQILMQAEADLARSPVWEGLRGALLRCMDLGSSLSASEDPDSRPRQLRVPPRYLERNVWTCLGQVGEEPPPEAVPVALAPDVDAFLQGGGSETGPPVMLQVGTLRALADRLPEACASLALLTPPRLDPTFWSLSYLWTGWLYGARTARVWRPLLRHRARGWEWYRRAMADAFRQVARLLQPGGHLVFIGRTAGSAQEAALLLAASRAGFSLVHALSNVGEAQFHVQRERLRPAAMATEQALAQGTALAEGAAVALLRARGEPTSQAHLYTAIAEALDQTPCFVSLAEADRPLAVLRRLWKGLEGTDSLVRGPDGRWWLRDEGATASPLADRVEAAVHELLVGTLGMARQALLRQVCAHFPGPLTPEVSLIEAGLRSYGEEFAPGYWRVRAEQTAPRQEAFLAEAVRLLGQLGERLGYEVERDSSLFRGEVGGYDVAWREEGHIAHGFLVRWSAQIATAVLTPRPEALHRYYLLPEARAELVRAKLAHDTRLVPTIAAGSWVFLKAESLRGLAQAKDVRRQDLRQVVGLEPIVEQTGVQIPLL